MLVTFTPAWNNNDIILLHKNRKAFINNKNSKSFLFAICIVMAWPQWKFRILCSINYLYVDRYRKTVIWMCDVAHKALGISGKDKPCPVSFLTTTQCETYISFFLLNGMLHQHFIPWFVKESFVNVPKKLYTLNYFIRFFLYFLWGNRNMFWLQVI